MSELSRNRNARLGLVFFAAIILLFTVGLSVMVAALLHPRLHAAFLVLIGLCLFPSISAFTARKGRLRGFLILKPIDVHNPRDQFKAIFRNPAFPFVIPIVIIAICWGSLYYNLTTKADSTTPQQWITMKIHMVVLATLLPAVFAACYLATSNHLAVAAYLSICCSYVSLTIAIGGLRLENGVLGFFEKWKAQSSPIVTLSCAAVFALSMAVLHLSISLKWPSEYAGLHGFQDSVYFSFVTMPTVGYGDVIAVGHLARWVTLIQIVTSFVMLVVAVSASMTVWIQKHQPTSEPEVNSDFRKQEAQSVDSAETHKI